VSVAPLASPHAPEPLVSRELPESLDAPDAPDAPDSLASSALPRARREPGLVLRVAIGTAFGGAYALVNDLIDTLWKQGQITGAMSAVHGAVDQAIPVFTGALVGVALHHVRSRSRLALEAQLRASELRAKLQRVERDQAAWVVAAATLHEVRNPLHALGLVLDELDAVIPDGIPDGILDGIPDGAPEARALLSSAQAQLDRVDEHLARLRTLSASGPPELVPLDVGALLGSLCREQRARAAPAGVSLELHVPSGLRAMGDASRARIVLENVIDNALGSLATRGHGRVEIAARRQGDSVVVTVRDDGPGVAPDVRARMFEPLRSTKEGGLGLGLSIGRALARAMQGDLELSPGPGTTFTLTLPAA
jgi:signal transduction histidine kinase